MTGDDELTLPPEFNRAASLACPNCGTFAQFDHRFTFEVVDEVELPRRVVGRRMYGGAPSTYLVGAWSCSVCGQPIVGSADRRGRVLTHAPDRTAPPDFPDVPEDIQHDAIEAHLCSGVSAWRACVTMARRAVQASCYERGAPDRKLRAQIDWLEEQRAITPQMRDMAHRIRITGNDGAHPDQDGLNTVGRSEAVACLGFLDELLRHLYTIPAALIRAEKR